MQKWEYIAIELFVEAKGLDFNNVLNNYGSDGWELVTVTATKLYNGANRETKLFAFFKRHKVEENPNATKKPDVLPNLAFQVG